MTRQFLSTRVATAAVLILAMGMGVGAIAAPVGAQSAQDQAADAAQNATNSTPKNPALSPSDNFLQPIDTETKIVDWSYRPGMFTITVEANASKRLSMTEAGNFEEGTGSFNYREVRLEEGTNTVTMPVTDRPGAGVALATRDSLEQGTGAFVSVGQIQRNPFRNFGGETGLFSGVLLTVGFAAIGAAYVVRSEDSGVIEA
ncbi:hypothetical protein [Natrinema halophilum]|uniref:Uncharacterized protein n=1 Tax=Natrinema halophilum TaxID=1699371 RepID=A0A7D5KU03_9EURY|nr:hypothetical protein [Natrinema halophilum]QLG51084.1 hypothetical protein HYG82_20740 [Natrinema halophilum]